MQDLGQGQYKGMPGLVRAGKGKGRTWTGRAGLMASAVQGQERAVQGRAWIGQDRAKAGRGRAGAG